MHNRRYNDYYLVNDEDMISNEEDDSLEPAQHKRKRKIKRILCIIGISLLVLAVTAFILVFVVFPLIFKFTLSLQQALVFTRWNLVSDKTYYQQFRIPEYKNHYISVMDIDNKTSIQLGLWHMLPLPLAEIAIYDEYYDYNAALKNSNYSVLLYFHGTGEDRSQSWQKYQLLRYFFHVIAFDYRGYGDSEEGPMFEENVINDCVQVYNWVQIQTDAPIYVWGHSLGSSLAAGALAHLGNAANVTGLILESAFTTFRDELYHHPYVKYFKWLPWFKSTVVDPLADNGFIFNTSAHIESFGAPIMFLHAKDDSIVPYFMSEKLYEISKHREVSQKIKNDTMIVLYDARIRLNHYFIYRDSFSLFYINEFMRRCSGNNSTGSI